MSNHAQTIEYREPTTRTIIDMAELESTVLDLGGSTVTGLMAILRAPDVSLHSTACRLLAIKRSKAAVPLLERLARADAVPENTRQAAIGALARIGEMRAVPSLLTVLHGDSSASLRAEAAYALGVIGSPDAFGAISEVATNRNDDPVVRARATEGLGMLGDVEAVDALVSLAADAIPEVRFWAAYALGRVGGRQQLPLLTKMSRTDHRVIPGWWSIADEARASINKIRSSNM